MQTCDVKQLLSLRNGCSRRIDWPVRDWCDKVKRVSLPGRGYGIVATSHISRGEVIGVSRALGVVYVDELPLPDAKVTKMNAERQQQLMQVELARQLREKVSHEKADKGSESHKCEVVLRLQRKLFSLFDGSEEGYGFALRASNTRLGLDSNDGFACVPVDFLPDIHNGGLINVDVHRLLDIIKMNGDEVFCFKQVDAGHNRRLDGVALFAESSWINHSFDPNVVTLSVCDVVIVRASQDISPGQELTRSYVTWSWDQEAITQKLQRYGVKLDACLQDCNRILPSSILLHQGWIPFCCMAAKIDREMLTATSATLDICEAALVRLHSEWGSIVSGSIYIQLRIRLLSADVQLRHRRLGSALRDVEQVIALARICELPAGELGNCCMLLLMLCVGLQQAPAPKNVDAFNRRKGALESLLREASRFASIFLGSGHDVFHCWARCWLGAGNEVDTLFSILLDTRQTECCSTESPSVSLEEMD